MVTVLFSLCRFTRLDCNSVVTVALLLGENILVSFFYHFRLLRMEKIKGPSPSLWPELRHIKAILYSGSNHFQWFPITQLVGQHTEEQKPKLKVVAGSPMPG